MRVLRLVKLLALVLALSTAGPIVSTADRSAGMTAAPFTPPRSDGDPDTPEWTVPKPGPVRLSSDSATMVPVTTAPAPTWLELLLRVFPGIRSAR